MTGYGQAARHAVLALDAAGVEVVPRPLFLSPHQGDVPRRLLELFQKSSHNCGVAIQHTLPAQYVYDGGLVNIGLFASETTHFRPSGWAERLNMMDAVWVINNQQIEACRASGVIHRPAVVPHACDVLRYQRSYAPIPELDRLRQQGTFLFYFIGEFVRRKNLGALLKAFHAEFDPAEPVELVLKLSRPGRNPDECMADFQNFAAGLKKGLRLYSREDFYKDEILITKMVSDEYICQIHSSCDCFVGSSFGEAWAIPAFDAMAFGKTPICPQSTGFLDYMTSECGWLIETSETPCFGSEDGPHCLYTADENWFEPSIPQLRRAMREAYGDPSSRRAKGMAGVKRAYDFSYEKVGLLMKNALLSTLNAKMAGLAGPGGAT